MREAADNLIEDGFGINHHAVESAICFGGAGFSPPRRRDFLNFFFFRIDAKRLGETFGGIDGEHQNLFSGSGCQDGQACRHTGFTDAAGAAKDENALGFKKR